jgi:hypothetical protein
MGLRVQVPPPAPFKHLKSEDAMRKFGWFALIVSLVAIVVGIFVAVKKFQAAQKSAPKSYADGEEFPGA